MFTFLEFFSGGGMARLGLGPAWRCIFANDFDPEKCAAYRMNFGGEELIEADVAALSARDLPRLRADLAWASFPCQDLSLAGARAGLHGPRSGSFHAFWRLMRELGAAGRAPRAVVIENVAGLLSSNGGRDFAAVVEAIASAGYLVSAQMIDARAFSAQSRPRLFIFGMSSPAPFLARGDVQPGLARAVATLPARARDAWRVLPSPPQTRSAARLREAVDLEGGGWSAETGARVLAAMSARQRAAVDALSRADGVHVGAAFRRIRTEDGARVQRYEARFDGLAGCLRTPAGGSSRQMLLRIDGARVCARLMRPREAARLMGLPDSYRLPEGATAALKLIGDGVSVPVVRWIGKHILEPALGARRAA